MATRGISKPTARTACDRCYELKERCVRSEINNICKRCDRLRFACSTVRPVRRAGRRPRYRNLLEVGTTTSSPSTLDLSTWLQEIPDLLPEEKVLLTFLLCQTGKLEYYVASPSFEAAEQHSLTAPLPAALPILKDAYLACAGALKGLEPGGRTQDEQNASLQHISSAMKTLRSLPVANSREAALCLKLGTTLALSVYSAIGVGVADICHYCLTTTKPFMEKVRSDSSTEPWQSILVLLEIMECVVHRRKPTLRIQPRESQTIDRHLGLCLPLLPYYYDLGVINHSLTKQPDANYRNSLEKKLAKIHAAVEAWQPLHSVDLINKFQTIEVINLLAQARIYRLGGLLLSHRLRHVFGQEDCQADIWAKDIMMELDLAFLITKRPIRCVTLPFIIAAVEIKDSSARTKALKDVANCVDQFALAVQEATRTFLSRIWQERDSKISLSWFNSVHKPCVILNYIGTDFNDLRTAWDEEKALALI